MKEPESDRIILIHIPKTGGMTVHAILKRLYPAEAIASMKPFNAGSFVQSLKELPVKDREKLKLILGHVSYGVHTIFEEPFEYISILRDPVNRIISQYSYVSEQPWHPLYKWIHENHIDIYNYVPRAAIEQSSALQLNNGQTRMISGQGNDTGFGECGGKLLDKALNNLENKIALTGTLEEFDKFLIMLKRKFNLDWPLYKRKNVTRRKHCYSAEEKQNIKDSLYVFNKEDFELYEAGERMFNSAFAMESQSIQNDLEAFKQLNEAYIES